MGLAGLGPPASRRSRRLPVRVLFSLCCFVAGSPWASRSSLARLPSSGPQGGVLAVVLLPGGLRLLGLFLCVHTPAFSRKFS